MKPRLKKIFRLWSCYSGAGFMGVGFTPQEAYDDWASNQSPEAA